MISAYSFAKKKKATGFCSFLKAFSWETDLWVTLGDFTVQKRKIGKGNLYLKSIKLKRNVLCCSKSQFCMLHMCERMFRFDLQLSSYWQNNKFSRNCPKFHIFTKIVIFQVHLHLFLDQLVYSDKFHSRDISEILFFIFASCEPLRLRKRTIKSKPVKKTISADAITWMGT